MAGNPIHITSLRGTVNVLGYPANEANQSSNSDISTFLHPPDCEDEPVVVVSYQSTSNSDLPSVLL